MVSYLSNRVDGDASLLDRIAAGRYNFCIAGSSWSCIGGVAAKGMGRTLPEAIRFPNHPPDSDGMGLAVQPRETVLGSGDPEKRFPSLWVLRRRVVCGR